MRVVRVALVLLGLVLMLPLYYWGHKPLSLPLAVSVLGSMLDLLSAAWVILLAGGLGHLMLRGVNLATLSRAERIAVQGVIGLGVVSLVALGIAASGFFHQPVLWGTVIIFSVLLARPTFHWAVDLRATARQAVQIDDRWGRFLVGLGLFWLGTALLLSLLPPYGWDSLMYHLLGPKRLLASGQLQAYTDNHYLGFPQLVEMLFAFVNGLFGRDSASAPLHFGFGVLGLLAVGGLVKRYTDTITAWIAVAILLSAYSMWLLFGIAYNDLAVLAYIACGVSLLSAWRENREMSLLALAGLCAGMAFSVKYTAGVFMAAFGVLVIFRAPRRVMQNGLIAGGAALTAYLPWALRGVILYGNPVYPFFFDGLAWDATRAASFSGPGGGLLGTPDAWQLAVMPFAATVFGVERGAVYSFDPGVWLLTAPFLALLGWRFFDDRQRNLLADLFILSGVLLIVWIGLGATTTLGAQIRLMMPLLPVAAALGALGFYGVMRWPRKPLNLGFILQAIFAISLVFSALQALRHITAYQTGRYLLAQISEDDVLFPLLGDYWLAMDELSQLPPETQVRMMWEPRAYYCPVQCIPDTLTDHWGLAVTRGETPEAILEAWRTSGDEYVLVWQAGYTFTLTEDVPYSDVNAGWADAVETHLTPVWEVGSYVLYVWR